MKLAYKLLGVIGGLTVVSHSVYAQSIVPSGINPLTAGWDEVMSVVNNSLDIIFRQLLPGLAFLIFIYAGFLYVTAAGDEGKTKEANGFIRNGIIGVLIAFLSVFAIRTVITYLNLDKGKEIYPFKQSIIVNNHFNV